MKKIFFLVLPLLGVLILGGCDLLTPPPDIPADQLEIIEIGCHDSWSGAVGDVCVKTIVEFYHLSDADMKAKFLSNCQTNCYNSLVEKSAEGEQYCSEECAEDWEDEGVGIQKFLGILKTKDPNMSTEAFIAQLEAMQS